MYSPHLDLASIISRTTDMRLQSNKSNTQMTSAELWLAGGLNNENTGSSISTTSSDEKHIHHIPKSNHLPNWSNFKNPDPFEINQYIIDDDNSQKKRRRTRKRRGKQISKILDAPPLLIKNNDTMIECITVDIDGTIANVSERINFAACNYGANTEDYHNLLHDGQHFHLDQPIPAALEFLQKWASDPERIVVYLSSRRKGSEQYTRDWLDYHQFPQGPLYQRPQGIKSWSFKKAELQKLLKKYHIAGHIGDTEDDRFAAMMNHVRFIECYEGQWLTEKQVYDQWVHDLIDIVRDDTTPSGYKKILPSDQKYNEWYINKQSETPWKSTENFTKPEEPKLKYDASWLAEQLKEIWGGDQSWLQAKLKENWRNDKPVQGSDHETSWQQDSNKSRRTTHSSNDLLQLHFQ